MIVVNSTDAPALEKFGWAAGRDFLVPGRTGTAPRCITHGEMRYRAAGHWWVCPGWDGEGCCAIEAERVTGEAAAYEPWPGSQPSRHGFRPARVAT